MVTGMGTATDMGMVTNMLKPNLKNPMQTTKNNPQIAVIIQARMRSTRLPGKVIRPFFNGETLISALAGKLRQSAYAANAAVMIAIPDGLPDNRLEQYAKEKKIPCFRGSEDNVLERFVKAAETQSFDLVVRICSDNLFLDIELMDKAIGYHTANPDLDYVSFKIDGVPAMLTHFGFFSEIIKKDALNRFFGKIAENKEDFEHVTKGIYTRPEEFKCGFIDLSTELKDAPPVRTTIDTPEDFELVNQLYREISEKFTRIGYREVLEFLKNNPELSEQMKNQINSNKK